MKLSKQEVLEKANNLTISNIRYYMNNINANNQTCLQWKKMFIKYITEDYSQTDSYFKQCTEKFNTFYWLPYCKN